MAVLANNWQGDAADFIPNSAEDKTEQADVSDDIRVLQWLAESLSITTAETKITRGKRQAATPNDDHGWFDARQFPLLEILVKNAHATQTMTLKVYASSSKLADGTEDVSVDAGTTIAANGMTRKTYDLRGARYARVTLAGSAGTTTGKAWLTARNR